MPAFLDKLLRKDVDASSDEALLDQIQGYPHLVALKPKEKMVFRSDYIEIDDDYVTTVLDFFHKSESVESFGAFWGADLIPNEFGEKNVTTLLVEQTRRMTDAWIERHQTQSDRLGRMSEREQNANGSTKGRQKVQKLDTDRQIIFREIQEGSSYLNVHYQLVVKAPNIETLDWAVDRIQRQYIGKNMSTLSIAAYDGEQRNAISRLFALNKKKRNKGFYFTSMEYAGAYGLITNGFDDPEGEYIGKMLYDYNKSAIVYDVDNFREHVVVAHPKRLRGLNNAYYSDAWCSKMSQAALQNNHKVVHIVLSDSTELDRLGPMFDNITRRIDMNRGEINMFEVFGKVEDEMSLYSRHIEKLKLMTDQLFNGSPDTKALAVGALNDILDEFYIEQGMWVQNAVDNRDDIRVIGIPHKSVPRLRLFRDYIVSRYETSKQQGDQNMTNVYNLLQTTYSSMLSTNGDLFDQYTTDVVDGLRQGRRVIYDFSGMLHRGPGTAMAQLINVISFAVSTLEEGDVVIFHGADNIVNAHDFKENSLNSNAVKQYINKELSDLVRRGGRVVYSYEKLETMIADREFNRFDTADYTVLGAMSSNTVNAYEEALGKNIPVPLKRTISNEASAVCFIRRGMENVVFELNLALGFTSKRTNMRSPEEFNSSIAPSEDSPSGDVLSMAGPQRGWSRGAEKRKAAAQKAALPRKKVARRTIETSSTGTLQKKPVDAKPAAPKDKE